VVNEPSLIIVVNYKPKNSIANVSVVAAVNKALRDNKSFC